MILSLDIALPSSTIMCLISRGSLRRLIPSAHSTFRLSLSSPESKSRAIVIPSPLPSHSHSPSISSAPLSQAFDGEFNFNSSPVGTSRTKRSSFEILQLHAAPTDDNRLKYLQVLGTILWAANMTRPEVAYYATFLSTFTHASTVCHTLKPPLPSSDTS